MRVTAAGAFNITFPMPIAGWWGGRYVMIPGSGIISNPRAATSGLKFQSGQSHEDLGYLLPAPSSAGSAPQAPCRHAQHCRAMHHAAPRLELQAAPS